MPGGCAKAWRNWSGPPPNARLGCGGARGNPWRGWRTSRAIRLPASWTKTRRPRSVLRPCPTRSIVLERHRVLEVGELLIGKPRRFAERAGCALPADSGVLIGEAALERHEDVAAAAHVIGDVLQQCIISRVQCRNDEEFVGREIGS